MFDENKFNQTERKGGIIKWFDRSIKSLWYHQSELRQYLYKSPKYTSELAILPEFDLEFSANRQWKIWAKATSNKHTSIESQWAEYILIYIPCFVVKYWLKLTTFFDFFRICIAYQVAYIILYPKWLITSCNLFKLLNICYLNIES